MQRDIDRILYVIYAVAVAVIPNSFTLSLINSTSKTCMTHKRILVISDMHIPYHHKDSIKF